MANVRISGRQIEVDGKPIPLISGEVHYWRLAPARWREILNRVKEMGLSTIATYVCWEYHEYERGKFDFTGETEPQRNLVGFLDLCEEMNLWVIIRPGPYIYSEWKNAGVPDYAAPYHRLSKEYQSAALPWMKAVTEVLKPRLATNGGRIICFQPDNEMDLFTHWFEDEMGFRDRPGLFHEFLKERYGSVDKLNEAWGTSYSSIEQAQVRAREPFMLNPSGRSAMLDYWRFEHWLVAKCVKWHADTYQQLGIDVPIYHNYYYGGDIQNHRELSKVVDFLGIDVYPGNEFENEGYPGRHNIFMNMLRYQRSVSPIPYIAEFECGVWHGLHEVSGIITPNSYRLMCFSAIAAGITGWNWYMLVGRDNWYFCPIQEWGRIRPELYDVMRRIVAAYYEINPPACEKLTDTAIVADPLHIAAAKSLRSDPTADALYEADIEFETLDLETEKIKKPLLFYVGDQWLSREDQQKLADYVESGGTLVFFKNYPRFDETQKPLNLLGIREPDRVLTPLGKRLELRLGSISAEAVPETVPFDYDPVEISGITWLTAVQTLGAMQAVENSDVLAINYQGRKFNVGYIEQRGKGKIIFIGLDPNPALVAAVHKYAGASTYARADSSGVHTSLLKRGSIWFLIAANNAADERRTIVAFDGKDVPSGECKVTDLWTGEESRMTIDSSMTIKLDRKSGNAWKIEPCR